MDSDNYKIIHCPEDDEYRVYCNTCDKLCKERFHKNHLKAQFHTINIHKRQQLKISISLNTNKYEFLLRHL